MGRVAKASLLCLLVYCACSVRAQDEGEDWSYEDSYEYEDPYSGYDEVEEDYDFSGSGSYEEMDEEWIEPANSSEVSSDSIPEADISDRVRTQDLDEIWIPPDNRTAKEWFHQYGLKDGDYNELKSLVSECIKLATGDKELTADNIEDIKLFGTIPSKEQAEHCVKQFRGSNRRKKRNAMNFSNFPTYKWKLPIIYKFDSSLDANARNVIEAAINQLEINTCIRFKRIPTGENYKKPHLVLGASGSGCWSFTGRMPEKQQPQLLNLRSPGCLEWLGVAVHELLHAIGMWHENVRLDRDKYIKVNLDLVSGYLRPNFDIAHTAHIDNYKEPYDLSSVMHYGPREMAKQGTQGPVITTLDPLYQRVIGQRRGMSFGDMKLACKMYGTERQCQCLGKLRCANGGYTDPNNCNRCKCPDGYGGKLCKDLAKTKGGCWPSSSEHIKLNSPGEYSIESRDYADGGKIKTGDKCNWLIEAPKGCQISSRFDDDFGLFCPYPRKICFQWVEVRLQSMTDTGPRFCCDDIHGGNKLVSESNRMMVILNADFPMNHNYKATPIPSKFKRGFRFYYKIKNPSCLVNPRAPAQRQRVREKSALSGAQLVDVGIVSIPIAQLCQQWTPWSKWSDCSRACSGCGKSMRYRKCLIPIKRIQTERRDCNIEKCSLSDVEYYRSKVSKKSQRLPNCCYKITSTGPHKLRNPFKCYITPGMGSMF